ncbi:hypothetical protein D3C80_2156920 [compost metagenome]
MQDVRLAIEGMQIIDVQLFNILGVQTVHAWALSRLWASLPRYASRTAGLEETLA